MGIILEFKDYREVHEALDMVNEGLLKNLWNKMKDMFKGVSKDVDETIASPEIDNMFDAKTGELTPELLTIINSIGAPAQSAQEQAPAQGASEESTRAAFEKIKAYIKTGWYFQQSLKFMEDGMVALMDQTAANKAGAGAAATTTAPAPGAQQTGGAQAAGMEKVASAEMEKRAKDFDNTYVKAKENLKKQVQTKMAALLKKSSAESTKMYINNRFSTCETVLLLIEYNIKKLRIGLKSVDALKKQMTESYKQSLESAKALQAAVEASKAAGGLTVDVYNKLDINGFIKEFQPSQVTMDAEGKVTEPADDKELFVYPYDQKHIVITAYDVNAKTVTFKYVDNHKITDEKTDPVPFDEFKEKLLEGSGGQPPIKQKGGEVKAEQPKAQAAPGGQSSAIAQPK